MINQFGSIYSKYYDLLYKDKDYGLEAKYILSILKNNNFNDYSSLIDLGCGTGKHLNELSTHFQQCIGIDISEGMISSAISDSNEFKNIEYRVSDVTSYDFNERFSCILSLFHVFSYLITDSQLNGFFESASNHSKPESYLLFDYYNFDGLMHDKPSIRTKIVENNHIKVERKATPQLNEVNNILKIDFDINIIDKLANNESHLFKESHSMRFFKQEDITKLASKHGFEILNHYKWLSLDEPNDQAWYACSLFKKKA